MKMKDYLKGIKEVRNLSKKDDIDKALQVADRMRKKDVLNPDLMINMGRLIQLSSEDCKFTLQQCEELLKDASKLDPNSAEAQIELGYYTHAVKDNSEKALEIFDEAIDICFYQMRQAIQGRMECLLYFERDQELKEETRKLKAEFNGILREAQKRAKAIL